MATTTILLREDIETLGGRGEIVTVKSGYARNFLLPKGIAILATKGNIKQVEKEREFLLKKAAEDKSTADLQAEQMKNIKLNFERKAGETGTLFGSVTSIDVTAALNDLGYEIDRKQVKLKDPIKELGEYTVDVRLHREVILEVPVKVRAEGELIPEEEKKEKAETKAEATAETKETTETVEEKSVPADSSNEEE
jgi:large subunit ribosomal protein L9